MGFVLDEGEGRRVGEAVDYGESSISWREFNCGRLRFH